MRREKEERKKTCKFDIGNWVETISDADSWRGIKKGEIGRVEEINPASIYGIYDLVDIRFVRDETRTYRLHANEIDFYIAKLKFHGRRDKNK